jgi:hypothetical protein
MHVLAFVVVCACQPVATVYPLYCGCSSCVGVQAGLKRIAAPVEIRRDSCGRAGEDPDRERCEPHTPSPVGAHPASLDETPRTSPSVSGCGATLFASALHGERERHTERGLCINACSRTRTHVHMHKHMRTHTHTNTP